MEKGVNQTTDNNIIVWLASYPKSGNTWFRAFLTALLGDGDLNINQMRNDGILSSRAIFEDATDTDSTYFYDSEIKVILPDIFRHVATQYNKERLFIKSHDAYTYNAVNKPIIPKEPTRCALYFIRNPLDIASSFANHQGSSIDEAISTMNQPKGALAKQHGNYNIKSQFRQLMLSWSGHVESWTSSDVPFPVLVLRYEDMLADGLNTFSKAVKFIGLEKSQKEIENALFESRFEKLKEQEVKNGFGEKNRNSKSFFRNGQSGGWKQELSSEQVRLIVNNHHQVMLKFGYSIPDMIL